MAAAAKLTSVEPEQRVTLAQVSWKDISVPGAYVEVGTGDLDRVPKDALLEGSSPYIRKESVGASRLAMISNNPFITTFEARMLCCEHNITPNF